MRPRADKLSPTVRDERPPLHRMSLFAAARRERRNGIIGQALLEVYRCAISLAFVLIVVGP